MKPGRFLTYDEVVRALRDAKRPGDCAPKDLKETARAIIAKRVRQQPHVEIRTTSEPPEEKKP